MGMPQRDGRPALDLTPDNTPETANWTDRWDVSMNTLNHPVPLHKGDFAENGWTIEPSEALPAGPAGGTKNPNKR